MSDEPAVQSVTPEAAPAGSAKGIKAFLGTTVGKIVLIGGAVAVLIGVLAVVGVIVLGALGGQAVEDALNTPPTGGASQGGGATVATKTVPAVPVVDNSEVFSPRDPFEPVVVPASATATESAGGDDDENTLTLLEIVEDNGVRKAKLRLGGTEYTLAAGEQLGSTPWQVVTVGTSSVTVLYGDSQIVLTVGQGIETK